MSLVATTIQPASFDQVKASPDGAWEVIPADWGHFAESLRMIDPSLKLQVNKITGIFAVFQEIEPDREDAAFEYEHGEKGQHLVQTATVLDERLLRSVAEIVHRTRNQGAAGLVAELQARRAERDRAEERAMDERLGDLGERTYHALRKDLDVQDRIFVPGVCKV